VYFELLTRGTAVERPPTPLGADLLLFIHGVGQIKRVSHLTGVSRNGTPVTV
jgi:hypothetical protein